VLATWPLYLLAIAYAPVYLGLFGPQYRSGSLIVTVLAGAMLVASACGMVDMVLAMGGRTWWNLANVALALVVMLGFDAVLVPRHGALGAAIGLAAAVLANNLVPLAQVRRSLGLHPFGRATLAAAGLALACFGPALLLPSSSRFAATGVGLAAYLFGISRLRTVFTKGGQ
jgi:O-antigen/teichoic acid export membrane protein